MRLLNGLLLGINVVAVVVLAHDLWRESHDPGRVASLIISSACVAYFLVRRNRL